METREFKTEVALSVLTGRLLCDFSDMHECIEFLAGEPVFTHQLAYKPFVEELARAVRFQAPSLDNPGINEAIGRLLPMLKPGMGKKEIDAILQKWLSTEIWPTFGESVPLVSMPNMRNAAESFTKPLEGKNVIAVQLPPDDQEDDSR